MNVLILAAGYATRLYPLTEKKAKPLLEVAGKPMIEWVLDNLAPIPDISTIYVVTNDKFATGFPGVGGRLREIATEGQIQNRERRLAERCRQTRRDRRHSVGHRPRRIDERTAIVVAGDNLFSEPLTDFAAAAQGTAATLATYDVGDLEAMKKYSASRSTRMV